MPSGIPGAIDRVTVRALRLEPEQFDALSRRMRPGGTFLVWARDEISVPAGYRKAGAVELADGRGRIVEVTVTRPRGIDE